MKWTATIIALGLCTALHAQSNWEMPIEPAQNTGFARVRITPELSSIAAIDYRDVRIHDADGQEVPYFLQKDVKSTSEMAFNEQQILEQTHLKKRSTIVFKSQSSEPLDHVALEVKNADVRKRIKLTGSNNNRDWFTIKEDFCERNFASSVSTNTFTALHFPKSDYAYYRMEISNKHSRPLNVLRVGWWETTVDRATHSACPEIAIAEVDTVKSITMVHLDFGGTYPIDKMQISGSGPALFMRHAFLATRDTNAYGSPIFKSIREFNLTSDHATELDFNSLRYRELYLVVENNDNQPLRISSVKAWQLNQYLVVHAEAGNSMTLTCGNPKLKPPRYDINYFKSRVPESPPLLELGNPKLVAAEKNAKGHTRQRNSTLLWSGLIALMVLIGGISIKIVANLNHDRAETDT